ncbi:hypothetical protein [Kitasatospora cheerisanensis]|uniref:Lipoprotein n=1 Tax=Kitasatospora cheerisanensis KCTC 2395 TaxID=1348663 RepID=A0A066YXJ1_9ACTN|nr:hypothetical protein [Kitasatospora cheerisanensis]KDN86253.1 hypothetical protein KCH_20700 [Kitasatospora cheerisanensis KCTC 2395]
MRGRIAVAAVAAALLLGGCAGTSAPPSSAVAPSLVTAGPEVRPATGDAARKAAEVAAGWPGSVAQQAWEHGYFPIVDTTEWLPPDAFHSGEDKAAYLSGHLDLKATLPVPVSDTSEVRFADGSRLVLPQRSAKSVFEELTLPDRPCSGHCEARLTVTEVRPGTTTVATSRGRADIAVWEFTVAGYDRPFRYPAVRSQDPYRPAPGAGPPAPPR